MSKKPCHESGTPGCGAIATERNRYFTGKYMAARDFSAEQEYFLTRHRLHNRVLHGWGVVCGLRVVEHPDPHCRPNWVVVKAGIAIDCWGREIVICRDTAFKLEEPYETLAAPDTPDAAPHQSSDQAPPAEVEGYHRSVIVAVTYTEELIEQAPALYAEGACDPSHTEANRIRETPRIVVLDPEEYPNCWPRKKTVDPGHCCEDCDEVPGPAGICLEPDCACGDAVALALVRHAPDDGEHPLHIHMDGRRTLPTPPEFLTHIVHINWPHGETISLRDLREKMHGRLEIVFDRKINPAHGYSTGINQFTFVVGYSDIQRTVEFMPIRPKHPPRLEGHCRAIYTIADEILSEDYEGLTLSNHMVYVTLNCDFILDCHDKAVDGNFIGAKLPSGNGTQGSTFRSWFRVRDKR
jgi:hypothetical protein